MYCSIFTQFVVIDALIKLTMGSLQGEIAAGLNTNQKVLSRRKRYIVFPEGSSFQLVYCLTMPTHGVGQIFTMGMTAALAWELPHEPIHFNKKNKEAANKRVDKLPSAQVRPQDKAPVTYYHSPWSSDRFTKYSQASGSQYINTKVTDSSPHYSPQASPHLIPIDYQENEYLPAYKNLQTYYKHRQVHRRTRRDLFEKIEKFFIAQGKDGRACLLKALCEVNQTPKGKQGTFVEEILKAIFTWIPDEDEETNDYDAAATYKLSCADIYPGCAHSVWDSFL